MQRKIETPQDIARLYEFAFNGKLRRLDVYELAVYSAIHEMATSSPDTGTTNHVTISVQELAELAGIHRNTVINRCQNLDDAGLIDITRRWSEPNTYILMDIDNVPKEEVKAKALEKAKAPRRRGRKPKERSDNHE